MTNDEANIFSANIKYTSDVIAHNYFCKNKILAVPNQSALLFNGDYNGDSKLSFEIQFSDPDTWNLFCKKYDISTSCLNFSFSYEDKTYIVLGIANFGTNFKNATLHCQELNSKSFIEFYVIFMKNRYF